MSSAALHYTPGGSPAMRPGEAPGAVRAEGRRVRDLVSPEEWHTRVELAACYRLVKRYGMSDMVYNHITAKVPGTSHFLINPFGMLYEEVNASCFYTIDLDANIVFQPDTPYGLNRAGFMIHSAVHGARPDINCVLHTHTRAGMAVSCMKDGLLPFTQTSMRFYGVLGYHDYEVPATQVSERERLARDLGPHWALVLRNHGLVTCGRSIGAAFNLMYWLEQACKVQVDVLSSGVPYTLPSPELASRMAARYHPDGPMPFGDMEWPALLREIERHDPMFKE